MKKPIFRQTALERLSSPEQLDQLMPVTSPRGWLALLALLALVAALGLWSVLDRVPVQVSGRGLLIRGGQLLQVAAPVAGQVERLELRAGDQVQAGQVIASLRPLGDPAAPAVDVRSLAAGQVVEVAAARGGVVSAGDLLATIEDSSQPLEVVVYLPAAAARQLRAGMAVEISPDGVSRDAHGFLRGVVQSVATFPASSQAMYAVLANDRLIEEFATAGAPLEVRVALLGAATGAYQWSAARAPAELPHSGALVTARFTTAERRPIELLWPGP